MRRVERLELGGGALYGERPEPKVVEVEYRLREQTTYAGLSEYDVIVGGEVVGVVEQCRPMRERRTKGRTYVNARWESKTIEWVYRLPSQAHGRSVPTQRRYTAVARLLGYGYARPVKDGESRVG